VTAYTAFMHTHRAVKSMSKIQRFDRRGHMGRFRDYLTFSVGISNRTNIGTKVGDTCVEEVCKFH